MGHGAASFQVQVVAALLGVVLGIRSIYIGLTKRTWTPGVLPVWPPRTEQLPASWLARSIQVLIGAAMACFGVWFLVAKALPRLQEYLHYGIGAR